jgi:endonuclease/exonuclease/phosphatase family metal-dependent hydrolase
MKELESGSYLNGRSRRIWTGNIRSVCWNINRGLQLKEVIDFLRASSADLILLQETDITARRTQRRNIPREIAQALGMNYIFGCEFVEIAQGSRSNPAYHGQTTLSRLPLSNARILRFREQSTFWRPRWFIPPLPCLQRRLGGRMALVCEIAVKGRSLLIYNVHLESRGGDQLRIRQLSDILADIGQHAPEMPVLLAGDFNQDLSREPAVSVVGAMGIDDPFAALGERTIVLKSRHGKPTAIDWMLTRGILDVCRPAIHESIAASDHFPLSFEFRLK